MNSFNTVEELGVSSLLSEIQPKTILCMASCQCAEWMHSFLGYQLLAFGIGDQMDFATRLPLSDQDSHFER